MEQQVKNTIYRFGNSFDTKDWELLESTLDREITCDYTDLRGSIDILTSAEYVKKRIDALDVLSTQHLFANLEIDIEESQAQCRLSAVIFRSKGGVVFNTHAVYLFKLHRVNDDWRIYFIKQKVLWNEGDSGIHSGAK